MAERIAALDGVFSISPAPKAGTLVAVKLAIADFTVKPNFKAANDGANKKIKRLK